MNKSKKNTEISFFYLIKKFPFLTFFHYLFGFLSAFINVKILGKIGDFIKVGDLSYVQKNLPELVIRLVLWGIIVFIHIALGAYLEELYSSHLREELYSKYLNANFSQTQKNQFALSNYDNDTLIVGQNATRIFNRCFYAASFIFLLFYEILTQKKEGYERSFIPWILLALFILAVVAYLFYRLSYRYRLQRNKAIQKENKYFEEIKNNIQYIKTTGSERAEIDKNKKLAKAEKKNFLSLALSKSLYGSIPNYIMLEYMPIILLFFLGGKEGKFWAGFYFLLSELFKQWKKLFEMLWAYGGYDTYRASLKQLNYGFTILEKNTYPIPKIYLLPPPKPNIIFQNIDFAYPETDQKILNDFSFTFLNGKKYVIIGPNGIGKSTLFKLMVKLYHPQNGVIKLDHIELEKIDDSTWQKKIIYLPNNPSFFNTSLGNNIVYPNTYQANIHQEKLEKIANELGIKEFINQLPNRWETTIAEKGQNLSEGQKQLVSLMRMFVHNYEICLLDEFLSNVSEELKNQILKVIFSKLKNRTIILISHDPKTHQYADEIYQFTPHNLVKYKIKI
jgi:ABC-type multidrug transport system fused ATPase/permease subunit